MSVTRWFAALVAVSVLGAGCTIGAPPGFSSGDSWSVPLVGPLEMGTLVVPVMIHDRGPYLFVIDTDAPTSAIDAGIDSELGLHSRLGGEYADESDVARTVRWAEVLRISVGTLTVRKRWFAVHAIGTFNQGGRQIRGVLGRDVLADSLVFGFDRDLGMAYLATQQGFTPPADAVKFEYGLLKYGVGPEYRHLVTARINGHAKRLHVDLGEVASQLRESEWSEVELVDQPSFERVLIDEYGTTRKATRGAFARQVEVAGAVAEDVLFVPYDDRRWREVDLDGTLGLGAFADYAVWTNFDDHELHLVPRRDADPTAERLARWGWAALDGCANPGCTRADLLEEPGADTGPPLLVVEREPAVIDTAMDVTFEARDAAGAPAGLPLLMATFPVGTARATRPLDAAYRGTTLVVIDISPFPRACDGDGACVHQFRPAH